MVEFYRNSPVMPLKIAYIHSAPLTDVCDLLPSNLRRASIVHSLIDACGLLKSPNVITVSPIQASLDDLAMFHDLDYVQALLSTDEPSLELMEQFQLQHDCPWFPELSSYVRYMAGTTLTACKCLIESKSRISVALTGGRHHAMKNYASGFCYVNDCVLAILALRRRFPNVLYVDVDVHHGDGVQEAFQYSPRVRCVSFHRHAAGVFPTTGAANDSGPIGNCLNVPLKYGTDDQTFITAFHESIKRVLADFLPDCIVVTCGADGIYGDPVNEWNLTPYSLSECINSLVSLGPLLLLGGGGYNNCVTAKTWAAVLSKLSDTLLPTDVPEHEFYADYAPAFEMKITTNSTLSLSFNDTTSLSS